MTTDQYNSRHPAVPSSAQSGRVRALRPPTPPPRVWINPHKSNILNQYYWCINLDKMIEVKRALRPPKPPPRVWIRYQWWWRWRWLNSDSDDHGRWKTFGAWAQPCQWEREGRMVKRCGPAKPVLLFLPVWFWSSFGNLVKKHTTEKYICLLQICQKHSETWWTIFKNTNED